MKLYDMPLSANCRRVRMFLTEKGARIEVENCFDAERVVLNDAYLARYSFRVVPMLELDDGRQIGESTAICRYFEALFPEPCLFGRTAYEVAAIEMWQQRINWEGEVAAEEVLRNSAPFFAGRGLAGSEEPVAQIPALIERGKGRYQRLLPKLDRELSRSRFIAGSQFSFADISLFCALDFAEFVGLDAHKSFASLARWYAEVKSRPSASS